MVADILGNVIDPITRRPFSTAKIHHISEYIKWYKRPEHNMVRCLFGYEHEMYEWCGWGKVYID